MLRPRTHAVRAGGSETHSTGHHSNRRLVLGRTAVSLLRDPITIHSEESVIREQTFASSLSELEIFRNQMRPTRYQSPLKNLRSDCSNRSGSSRNAAWPPSNTSR